VLRAWHEIDDQLTRYNASQLRRDSLAEAVRQNQIALTTAQHQYVEGVVDFVNVLTVQSALLATQEQWVESSTGVSLAMVGLYKALGGGWESVYPLQTLSDSAKTPHTPETTHSPASTPAPPTLHPESNRS